jgi:hypothetical protein
MIVKVRDFILDLVNTGLSVIKILVLSDLFPKKNSINNTNRNEDIVALGNGPSLKEFLANNRHFLDNKASACVNYFGRTEEYTEIKPEIYTIISPEYFQREEKKDFAEERQRTLDTIAEKTKWPTLFVIPRLAKKESFWKKNFINHPYITIQYVNTTPIEGFKWFKNWAYSKKLGMPRPHNVLIPTIMNAINLGYKNVFVAGADHSWLEELRVDSDNEVLLSQKHFYDKQARSQKNYRDMSVAQPMYHGATANKRKLHEVLQKFYYAFQSYWVIRDYAMYKKVQVFNITPKSYIDAFDRYKLD